VKPETPAGAAGFEMHWMPCSWLAIPSKAYKSSKTEIIAVTRLRAAAPQELWITPGAIERNRPESPTLQQGLELKLNYIVTVGRDQ
jgi:hypothetical protein